MEKKIDTILKKIEEFDSKLPIINRLEEKIDKFQLQLAENEERMKNYITIKTTNI